MATGKYTVHVSCSVFITSLHGVVTRKHNVVYGRTIRSVDLNRNLLRGSCRLLAAKSNDSSYDRMVDLDRSQGVRSDTHY